MATFDLPWPPSVNRYWRKWRNRMVIGAEGRSFRASAFELMYFQHAIRGLTGRLAVTIEAYPPDKRVRDLDNILKSLLDAMQHAGLYKDDSQIDRLIIERKEVEKPGKVRVNVREIKDHSEPYAEYKPDTEAGC